MENIKLAEDEIKLLIEKEEAFRLREFERKKLNKSLINLLKKAGKRGLHLNTTNWPHTKPEIERFEFSDSAMLV
jgi:hypothetical protein